MPVLLPELRHPGEEKCCRDQLFTAWSCNETHGSETAFVVSTRPQLTPHLANHSSAFCKGVFMLKDVKTHADISFGCGFETLRSSRLWFLVNPLVRGNISLSKLKSYTKPTGERGS